VPFSRAFLNVSNEKANANGFAIVTPRRRDDATTEPV